MINGKLEEKSCGDGPSLEEMIMNDVYLQDIIKQIQVTDMQFGNQL